jgi:hypothetical protein
MASEFEKLTSELEELNSLISLIKGIVNRGEVNPRKQELEATERRCLQLVEGLRMKYKKGIPLQASENLGYQVSKKNFDKLLGLLTTQLNRVKSIQEDEQVVLRRESIAHRASLRRQSTTSEANWAHPEIELLEVSPELDLNVALLEEKNQELKSRALTRHRQHGRRDYGRAV